MIWRVYVVGRSPSMIMCHWPAVDVPSHIARSCSMPNSRVPHRVVMSFLVVCVDCVGDGSRG